MSYPTSSWRLPQLPFPRQCEGSKRKALLKLAYGARRKYTQPDHRKLTTGSKPLLWDLIWENTTNNSDAWKCLPTFLMQPQLLEGKDNIIKTDKLKLEMIFKCLPKHTKNFFQMFNVWTFFNVLEIQMFNGNFECFCGSKAQQWWAIFGSHGWNIVQENSYESYIYIISLHLDSSNHLGTSLIIMF